LSPENNKYFTMKRKTRSILDEISNIVPEHDRSSIIESRAVHIITSAVNLINLIRETYDPEIAGELERRLLNSIRGQDSSKFMRGMRRTDRNED
jgi:hypothetical protein